MAEIVDFVANSRWLNALAFVSTIAAIVGFFPLAWQFIRFCFGAGVEHLRIKFVDDETIPAKIKTDDGSVQLTHFFHIEVRNRSFLSRVAEDVNLYLVKLGVNTSNGYIDGLSHPVICIWTPGEAAQESKRIAPGVRVKADAFKVTLARNPKALILGLTLREGQYVPYKLQDVFRQSRDVVMEFVAISSTKSSNLLRLEFQLGDEWGSTRRRQMRRMGIVRKQWFGTRRLGYDRRPWLRTPLVPAKSA